MKRLPWKDRILPANIVCKYKMLYGYIGQNSTSMTKWLRSQWLTKKICIFCYMFLCLFSILFVEASAVWKKNLQSFYFLFIFQISNKPSWYHAILCNINETYVPSSSWWLKDWCGFQELYTKMINEKEVTEI